MYKLSKLIMALSIMSFSFFGIPGTKDLLKWIFTLAV